MVVLLFVGVLIWYSGSTAFSLYLQDFLYSVQNNYKSISIFKTICIATFIQSSSCWVGAIVFYTIARTWATKSKLLLSIFAPDNVIASSNDIENAHTTKYFFIAAGILHASGVLVMNLTLALSNIPCVHTIRCLEPLLAGLFVHFTQVSSTLNQSSNGTIVNNTQYWISILVMLFGVALATFRGGQCTSLGFTISLGMITNILMITRNVCIQRISRQYDSLLAQCVVYTISTVVTIFILLTSNIFNFPFKQYVFVLCLIGIFSFIYHSTSIVICSMVTLVAHSLLMIFKRLILIVVAAIYFRSRLNSPMIVGSLIAAFGLILYKVDKETLKKTLYRTRQFSIGVVFILLILCTGALVSRVFNFGSAKNAFSLRSSPMRTNFSLFYWKMSGANENFGDKLSHILLMSIVGPNLSLITAEEQSAYCKTPKLLAIGSIFQFSCENDVIWGSGVLDSATFPSKSYSKIMRTLDIRAVRGPRTRQFLMSTFNISVPEVYGDPALLLPYYLTGYKKASIPTILRLLILHFRDDTRGPSIAGNTPIVTINACLPWDQIINLILQSELVISTSLHGIIAAEAFGVPARVLVSPHVELFKFHDYFEGTQRKLRYANNLSEAIQMGGEIPMKLDLTKLRNAFPMDKFEAKS
ncbi:unnamed protein product [Rotaria socialis]|uniref:Polysaccharide pyruvyl transferase domain-containing protein n=1 Tax=Rotaria socialis TaxID=392032 RepID=A0A818RLN0_9BILA|nr:unnamed protein product [Rotaria socialis]